MLIGGWIGGWVAGRWTAWSRGELAVTRLYDDETTGRLVERRRGNTTTHRYTYANTSISAAVVRSHTPTRSTLAILALTESVSDRIVKIG